MNATKKLSTVKLIQTFLLVVAIVTFLVGFVNAREAGAERKYQKAAQKAAEEIEITITDKVNTRAYGSSVEFDYTFSIKNNSDIAVNYIVGVMEVKNADGTVLSSGEAYFGTTMNTTERNYTVGPEKETIFTLHWDMDMSDAAVELWETDFSDLTISYEITGIRLENNEVVAVECDPYVKAAKK